MQDFRSAHLNASEAFKAEPKTDVDILEITKKTLVEAAELLEHLTGIKSGGRTGGKNFTVVIRQVTDRIAAATTPSETPKTKNIAEAVNQGGVLGL